MLSTIATDIKDFSLSNDGKEATFVLVTKHSGEIGVTVPAGCLKVLNPPAVLPTSSAYDGHKTPNDKATQVTIVVPQKWSVAADPHKRLVIVVLDPTTSAQSGFALHPQAANELAGELVKKSEAIMSGQQP